VTRAILGSGTLQDADGARVLLIASHVTASLRVALLPDDPRKFRSSLMPKTSRKQRTAVRASITALTCTLVLTACGGESGEGDAGGESTLTYAMGDFGNDALDPAMETNGPMQSAKFMMWDTLLEIGPEAELAPGIAESWTMAEDGLSWTFELREGVEFHNGEALTADDVKFSIERMLSPDATYSQTAQAQSMVDSVEVVDDFTVVVNTKGVQVTLPYLFSAHRSLAGIVFPQDYLLEEGGATFEEQRQLLEEAPIGSGPFRFVERVTGESMVFEAVEEHWRATPAVDRVEILHVSEPSTQVSMLQAGEVDIIDVVPDQAANLEGAGYEIRTVDSASELVLFFPGTWRNGAQTEPAGDVRVRQALSLAIDRQTIIDTLLAGYGSLKTTPYNTIPATQDIEEEAFADWAEEANAYDPERARELLAEAGYPDGFDGIRLFTFPLAGSPNLAQVSEIVAAQWAEIGVTAEIVPTDYSTYRPHLYQTGPDDEFNRGDANTYGYAARHDAIGALQAYIVNEGGNFQLTNIPELDALQQEASRTTDDEERQALIEEAFKLFLEEWAVIEIAMADAVYAVDPESVGPWQTIPSYPYLGRTFETIEVP
jgi:peptide/nickel transport system substrate-binding protein